MLPKIDVPETMLERMTTEDRVYKSAAEVLIHQFQSEPTNGIQTTGKPTDSIRKELLGRRFREFCKSQFPELDDWELWKWYRWYLVQTGRYTVREDRGYGIAKFTGYEVVIPRINYQHTSESKPRPKVTLVEYDPNHDTHSGNGFRRLN